MTMLGGQTPCRFCGLTAGHTFMCPAPDMVRQNEEIASLKQQLANVTRERDELVADKCATWGEKLCAQLAAAWASEALLRKALEGALPFVECSRAAGEELDAALRALRALTTTKEHGDAEKAK